VVNRQRDVEEIIHERYGKAERNDGRVDREPAEKAGCFQRVCGADNQRDDKNADIDSEDRDPFSRPALLPSPRCKEVKAKDAYRNHGSEKYHRAHHQSDSYRGKKWKYCQSNQFCEQ
jgi:hypothetical protein